MMLLLTLVGTTIGLCISVFSKSENVALALVPVVIIPQIILAGGIGPALDGLLKVIASLFIPAYWGYGGAGSLLNFEELLKWNEHAKSQVNLDDWTFPLSPLVLLLQLYALIGTSIWKLVSEQSLHEEA